MVSGENPVVGQNINPTSEGLEVKPLTSKPKGVVWCRKASKYHPIYRLDLVVDGKNDTEWFGVINDKFIDFRKALSDLLSRNGLKKEDVIVIVLDEINWGRTGGE